jgi:hypothetical protein
MLSILRSGHGSCHLVSGGSANVVLRYHRVLMNDGFTPELLSGSSVPRMLSDLPRSELVDSSVLFESKVQWAMVRLMQPQFITHVNLCHIHRRLDINQITSIESGDFAGLGALTGL